MVAGEKVHWYPVVNIFGKFTEQTRISFGNGGLVLKPEVEEVAHEEQRFAIVFDGAEEGHKHTFSLMRVVQRGHSEMEVCNEINLLHQNGIGYIPTSSRRFNISFKMAHILGSATLAAFITSSCVTVTARSLPPKSVIIDKAKTGRPQ